MKMWMDMEQHIPKSIWQGEEHNQEECNHDSLQWKGTVISGNRYVEYMYRNKSSANKGLNVVSEEQSTWQCSAVASSVHS